MAVVTRLIVCLILNVFLSVFSSDGIFNCRLTSNMAEITDFVVNQRTTLILNCSSIGRNITTLVEWKKDDSWVKNTSSSIYHVSNITREDAGKYECTCISEGQRTEPCNFIVGAPPLVRVKTVINHDFGAVVDVNCSVSGYPVPTATLYIIKNHKTVPLKKMKRSGKHGHSRWWTVTQKNLDNGVQFTCQAKNDYGISNDTTPAMTCLETTKSLGSCPKFKGSENSSITVGIGQSVTLTCSVTLTKKNYFCYKVVLLHRQNNATRQYWLNTSSGDNANATYRITKATRNDTGTYTCRFNKTKKMKHCYSAKKTYHLFVKEQTSISSRKRNNVNVAVAVSVTGAILGFALAFLVYYMRKRKLKSQHFYDSLPELRWDVFVSYSRKDFQWVKELCETLEKPPFNLHVCLHQRDWEAGRTVIDNMADSVYCSQKTLLIISKHYIESSYCMQELRIAVDSESALKNIAKDRIVVIKIDDVSLKSLPKTLRQKSYLDFSSEEQRKHYKKKLMKALPRRELAGNENKGSSRDLSRQNSDDSDIRLDEITNHQMVPLV